MWRATLVAVAFAAVALLFGAEEARAECFGGPPLADSRLEVGYAFIATVEEASSKVTERATGYRKFDWHVELDVTRQFRGALPDRLGYNGFKNGCTIFDGDQLKAGDRIFVFARVYEPGPSNMDPFTHPESSVVAWKRVGDEWRFFAKALPGASSPDLFPPATRDATTRAEILALLATAKMPDTSTAEPSDAPSSAWTSAALVAAFAIGLLAWHQRCHARHAATDEVVLAEVTITL